MRDVEVASLAEQQFNRFSRAQLAARGVTKDAIDHRVSTGRWVVVEPGVYAIAPVFDFDHWGSWKAATLTAPMTYLSRWSALAAYGLRSAQGWCHVTRPGTGGPRRHGSLLVFRSSDLEGDTGDLRGVPILRVERCIVDTAPTLSDRALARLIREAVRLELTTLQMIGDALKRHRGRRGTRRIAEAVARYSGLPLQRARSGAEIRAVEILRDAGRQLPALNVRVAGEEADLSWADQRRIIEIDGGPYHLDKGEDARKEHRWRAAGWTVGRISSTDVYERPAVLLAIAP